MSDTWYSYSRDPRTPCRYGTSCYSRNIGHQKQFKHPPNKSKRKADDEHDDSKRPKFNGEDQKLNVTDTEERVPQSLVKGDENSIQRDSSDKKMQESVDSKPSRESSDPGYSFARDPRKPCRYASRCFSKNDVHLKKFKHLPKATKQKIDDAHNNTQHLNIKKDQVVTDTKEKVHENEPKTLSKIAMVLENEPQNSKTNSEKPLVSDDEPQNSKTDKAENPKVPENETQNSKTKAETPQTPDKTVWHGRDVNTDKILIKELFLVEMPPDFHKFFECLKTEQSIKKLLADVNLQLIGPFELLFGRLPKVENKELYLVHWRFFYDPPEFQAVIKSDVKGSQFHIGYYRDSPDENPVFVASNDSAKDCRITPLAGNIFGAVYCHLKNEKKRSPFIAMAYQRVMDKVKKWAEQTGFSLEEYNMKKRQAQIVTKTLHGAGIVVPYDKTTQLGYRKLVETDVAIKKMFARLAAATTQSEKDQVLSELQPVITYASIALDECDFGTGLEVGIDLFCSGIKELEPSAVSSLCSSYMLLNRGAFAKIFEAHMKYRRKGAEMSLSTIK